MTVTVDLWLTSTEAWLHRQETLAASLSHSERERRDRFVDPSVGLRFALGRGLLRTVLASRLHIDPAAVQFETGEMGKPRLASALGADDLRFNASGSQSCLAIAMCTTCDVGVDVECHRAVSDALLRSSSILSENEREKLASLPGEESRGIFLRWWARKEAVAKADGRGIGFGLSTIDAGSPGLEAQTRIVHAGGRSFLLSDSDRVDGAYCTVAAVTSAGHPPSAALIRHVDYADVVDELTA